MFDSAINSVLKNFKHSIAGSKGSLILSLFSDDDFKGDVMVPSKRESFFRIK